MQHQWCGYCGSIQHDRENCPKTAAGQGNRQRMKCGYCGDKNHNIRACPKITAPHNRKPGDYVRD